MWRIIGFMLGGLMIGSCSSLPRHPAKGQVLGQTVVTNVDSEIAKYYLERGGSPGTEVRFEEKIRSIHSKYDSAPLDWITIKNVSAETSADFGAIYFARRLQMDSESSRFQNEFQ